MQHTSIQQLREFCANVAVGSGDKYLIEACRDGRNATITCSCQAGQHRQHCKHWFALMDGDVTGLLSDNTRDVELLQVIKAGTDIDKYLELVD